MELMDINAERIGTYRFCIRRGLKNYGKQTGVSLGAREGSVFKGFFDPAGLETVLGNADDADHVYGS